jgi:translation initiation factor 2 subunit 3
MDSDRENQHEYAESDDGSDSEQEAPPTNSIKSVLKQAAPEVKKPDLPEQPEPETLDFSKMTPLSPEIISRQATYGVPKVE